MFMTVFPANALLATKSLFPIANYDLDLFGLQWNLSKDGREHTLINDQMKGLGYLTTNSLNNLGTISTFVMVYLFQLFVLILTWIIYKSFGKGQKLL